MAMAAGIHRCCHCSIHEHATLDCPLLDACHIAAIEFHQSVILPYPQVMQDNRNAIICIVAR